MKSINDRKCLASWAVFKRLCDEGHKNIYEVLRDFVKATIFRHGIRTFTAASLTEHVNRDYEFSLKTAVVAFAIKDLNLTKDPKTNAYECDPSVYSDEADVDAKIAESNAINNEILGEFFAYVEQENGVLLSDNEKESLIHSLIHYLLNNSYEDTNSTLVSAFILRCRKDQHLSDALNNILEGVVRYVGVSFDSPENASSHWTNEMTIYLDTEILFHMAGYNGTLYKQLFDDFFELVNEINNDSLKQRQYQLIKLKYFAYVPEEIDKFFERADDIINGKIALNPSVTAMKTITMGCKTESEIAEKKGLFLAMISQHGIEPDNNENDFYHTSQFAYNLEDEGLVTKFCQENNYKRKKLVQNSLLSLSHVNVLRQGVSNRSFEKLGFVLLTDNYITEKVARMEEIKKEDDKPLCTNLYYVTNRMWFKLGKTFGKNVTPKVFDVISKAQIILSTKINDSVYSQYETLVEKMDNKEISSEGALEVLYQLRSKVKNPEEIDNESEVEEAMSSVGEPELQKYIEDAEYRKAKLQQTEEENKRLNRINEQVTARNEEITRQNASVLQENESVKQENKRVKAESIQKGTQLDESIKLNEALTTQLEESRRKQYETETKLYNKNKDEFIIKRRKQTRWQLFWIITFFLISIGLAYLASKFEVLPKIPEWLKSTVLLIVGQVIPFFRARVAKTNFSIVWRVIFKRDLSIFEEEYKQDHPEPSL